MYRSLLYLNVKPGKVEALIDWYRDVDSLGKAVELVGCVATEIYPLPDEPNCLLVTALWRGEGDYQRWVDHPYRKRLTGGINEFLDDSFTESSKGLLLTSILSAPN
ncbi:MAG: antibiotic biosynthesis monooxygenase [Bifidobacteriaceae bacterium]|jgi:quinol monooxygenase YgiN|nr:antibiotic biosynthesis monooxygenase [Bifidobacteriaceae bacterium]